ncbi:hypothetical protein QE152_g9489 [Popillia japonica]|uniref:Uncharacterized protein n=1 Tax=Popillia japonica TaxID=7064 RepID=A0AAW1LUG7_POPJA
MSTLDSYSTGGSDIHEETLCNIGAMSSKCSDKWMTAIKEEMQAFKKKNDQKGGINVEFVPSDEQLGDMFTKPLRSVLFKRMCSKIGLHN